MRAFRTLISSLAVAAVLLTALTANAASRNFSALDRLMRQAVADSVFPGASIAVIQNGRIVYHKAFGRMTYDRTRAPADPTTIYDAASLTNAVVTTSIAMQLTERDSLDIHA
ncbi:MAG: serine hydrolase, partial [Chlorobiales bacterium]|nr:serine hydrolase [Chlorobiales bacterium]